MRLERDEILMFQQVGGHNQQFASVLARVRAEELEQLSQASPTTFCTLQGRVQVLTELQKLLSRSTTP